MFRSYDDWKTTEPDYGPTELAFARCVDCRKPLYTNDDWTHARPTGYRCAHCTALRQEQQERTR